jgi:DNA-binding transcriptional MerR regulator
MTITELSDISGVSVSTIKFYIREKLLPKVFIQKGTRRYYTNLHIERLDVINKFKKEGMSINEIKKIFNIIHNDEDDYIPTATTGKYDIIDKVMPLFRKHGYDGVTITDIANAANIGCSTFYKHFKSKKDLFIECIQKIISDEARQIDEIKTDREVFDRETFHRQTDIFFGQYLLWRDMIKTLRAVSISKPTEFSETFNEVIQLKVDLFEKRISEAIEAGYIRKVNKTLLAVMGIGILELCSDYFSKPEYSEDDIKILLEEAKDIFLLGILER